METGKILTTILNEDKAEVKTSSITFKPDDSTEQPVINLYPEMRYQTFMGFGGALTEAAAYTFSLLDEAAQEEVLELYFGKDGANYTTLRMALDSCDFALGNYSAVEDGTDTALATFSLERDEQYILPMLRRVQGKAGKSLPVLLSPWSPPAFMKTNGKKNGGGKLRPECRGLWAAYICRYIQEYRAMGVDVQMLTIQNEPKAVQTWDSCVFTAAEEKEFLRDYLYPALKQAQLLDVAVLVWDHNKERVFDRACEIIDGETLDMVGGIAFHWYSGDHFDAVALVKEKWPEKRLVFSEGCVEYSRYAAGSGIRHAEMYAHDIIGDLRAGMDTWFDWNILLDTKGGPNHVGNYCGAPVMQTETGVEAKQSYQYIKALSRAIQPGAVRVATTCYTDKIEHVAFLNPNGTVALALLNRTGEELPAVLRTGGKTAKVKLPAHSLTSCILG